MGIVDRTSLRLNLTKEEWVNYKILVMREDSSISEDVSSYIKKRIKE